MLDGYLLSSAPPFQAIPGCPQLSWGYSETLPSHPAHDECSYSASKAGPAPYQMPTYTGGLPSPPPTATAATPPGQLRHAVSPEDGPWSPTSQMSPLGAEDMSGVLFNSLPDPALFEIATATPTAFETGAAPGWTNTGLPFDATYSEFMISTLAVSEAPTALSTAFWPEHIAMEDGSCATNFSNRVAPEECCAQETVAQSSHAASCANPPGQLALKIVPVSSRSRTAPTRSKALGKKRAPHMNTSTENPPPGPSLRTATRKFKQAEAPPKPGESPERRRARTNHNMVEQEYRRRLTKSFKQLLESLPEDILPDEGADGNSPGPRSKKKKPMSKVDVLQRTVQVIKFLESDVEKIRREVVRMKAQLREPIGGAQLVGNTLSAVAIGTNPSGAETIAQC